MFSHIQKMLFGQNTQIQLDHDLLHAVASHDLKKVETAISSGANVNAKGNDGESALMIAAARFLKLSCILPKDQLVSYLNIAQLLLNKGAAINAQDNLGRTALMYIGLNTNLPTSIHPHKSDKRFCGNLGRGAMTKLLLSQKECDAKLKDKSGKTALDYLIEDAFFRNDKHDGIELVAIATNSNEKLKIFEIQFKEKMEAEEKEYQEAQEKERKKKAAEQAKIILKYDALKKVAIEEKQVKQNGPKNAKDWPEELGELWMREDLHALYTVINDANLWNSVSPEPGFGGFMFNRYDLIEKHPAVEACGFSTAAFGWAMRIMQKIANVGWESYCNEVNKNNIKTSVVVTTRLV